MRRLTRVREQGGMYKQIKIGKKRMVTTHPPLLREQAGIHKHIEIYGKRVLTNHPPMTNKEQGKV